MSLPCIEISVVLQFSWCYRVFQSSTHLSFLPFIHDSLWPTWLCPVFLVVELLLYCSCWSLDLSPTSLSPVPNPPAASPLSRISITLDVFQHFSFSTSVLVVLSIAYFPISRKLLREDLLLFTLEPSQCHPEGSCWTVCKAEFLIMWLFDHTAAWRLRGSQCEVGSQLPTCLMCRCNLTAVCALMARLPEKVGFSEPELNFRNTPFSLLTYSQIY